MQKGNRKKKYEVKRNTYGHTLHFGYVNLMFLSVANLLPRHVLLYFSCETCQTLCTRIQFEKQVFSNLMEKYVTTDYNLNKSAQQITQAWDKVE